MDDIDNLILEILKRNSRETNRNIGLLTHMSGQAVGIRINKMIEDGIIQNYTVKIDKSLLGIDIVAIIKIFMTTHSHEKFLKLISTETEITEAHKVSSDACYILKIETNNVNSLNILLDKISFFGNYQVSLSTKQIK